MYGRSDPADSLGKRGSIPGISTLQDDLNTSPHLARRPGIGHLAAIHFTVDSQMPFNPGDGINGNSFGHIPLPLQWLGVLNLWQHGVSFYKIEVTH
jgi:hypothetical protein